MEKHGSNKIGQTSNNLEKVGIEQNLDDSSSETEESEEEEDYEINVNLLYFSLTISLNTFRLF